MKWIERINHRILKEQKKELKKEKNMKLKKENKKILKNKIKRGKSQQ